MNPNIVKVAPVWGQTLRPGYCAFTLPSQGFDFVGDGIGYFERFEASGGLPFCHALALTGPTRGKQGIIEGDCEVIEAHARLGVHRAQVSEYFAGSASGKGCPVFVRIPRGYSEDFGNAIVRGMIKQLGDKYGYGLIVADLLANTALGHWVNEHTGNVPDHIVCKFFTDRHHRICSQAVAAALKDALRTLAEMENVPQVNFPGCLRQPADTIDPKALGNDPVIWEPIIYQIA